MVEEPNIPLVSIIIPCYNQAPFLSDAIESALAQTHSSIQVVVVDDGSVDNTFEIAERYQPVCVLRQENQGRSAARNTGFHASRGEYVLFLDADDRLTSNAVEEHLRCFVKHPDAGFVVGAIDHISKDGSYLRSPRWPIPEANHYEELLKVNHVANTIAVMFRRSVIERVGGFKSACSPAEDYEILLHAARLFPSAHHHSVVAQYRRHDANTSRSGAVMLRMMHKVMQSQLSFVNDDSRLKAAHRKGELYWRDYFGKEAIKETFEHLVRGAPWRAARSFAVLLWYVRGRLFHFPWKYRQSVLRAVKRRLGTMRKEADCRASKIVGDKT
jgi:glycosyltransferase involved in cell wall biosynthesis